MRYEIEAAFNLTMEELATSIAISLPSDKLIFLTEVPGILVRPTEPMGQDNRLTVNAR